MGEDLVDLVSSSSSEGEDVPRVVKRPRHLVVVYSDEEDEEDSEEEDDEEDSLNFDEVFDDDAEFLPSATLPRFPTIVLDEGEDVEMEEQEEDEETRQFNLQRQTVLGEIRSLDEEEKRLQQELARMETMIAVVQSKRDNQRRLLAELQRNSSSKDKTWSSENFKHSKPLRAALQKVFGFSEFRELQLQALNATLCNRDCFVVLPTGSGKSLLFQLPAVVQGGITLVVSPLLSLSRDQIYNLERLGIQALMISSAQSAEELKLMYTRLRSDDTVRLVYVTPEMLIKSKKFVSALEQLQKRGLFRRICIDEAHCCSTMGHDFRPDYQKLFILRRQFAGVPILCVTATATVRVEEDVRETLSLGEDWVCFRASFNRPNLRYEVLDKPAEHGKFMYQLLDIITRQHRNQSGIIYCFSKKDTERIAQDLCNEHVSACCYHSKVPPKDQARAHTLWRQGKIKVVVATTSFGMGIDMPGVRFVIHACLSTSTEGYVQESGRAGRDGKPASCILLYRRADVLRVSSLVSEKKNGWDKLREMVEYCENALECRRVVTGRCFGEQFDANKCLGQCDVCATTAVKAVRVNHTVPGENLLRRFMQLKRVSPTVTMNQLVDAWRKASTGFVCPGGWTVLDCERLVMHLLTSSVLKVVWSYTPYGANSYLEQGNRAKFLCGQQQPSQTGELRIEYGVPVSDCVMGAAAAKKRDLDSEPKPAKTPSVARTSKSRVSPVPLDLGKQKGDVNNDSIDEDFPMLSRKPTSRAKSKAPATAPIFAKASSLPRVSSIKPDVPPRVGSIKPDVPPTPSTACVLSAAAKLPNKPSTAAYHYPDDDQEEEFDPDEYFQ
ncbi:hypothetical protein BASA81_010175 [Batrachochytrium salamandrivorans]|nr:hypothetical protein BASA81_010175 [Batrachochytrium salamandrivorans]